MGQLRRRPPHHARDYEVDALIALLKDFRARHGVAVYLEPGEAVAYHAGVLVAEVLDIVPVNGMPIAILDTSATATCPTCSRCPTGRTCSAPASPAAGRTPTGSAARPASPATSSATTPSTEPLRIGQRLVFDDMAHYTMVKTTTFNGINLPSIAIWNSQSDALRVVRSFGYEDFKGRLS